MNNEQYEQFYKEATKVYDVIEDSVAKICNKEKLSGQKVWTMVAAVAHLKLQEYPDNDTLFFS